MFDEDKKNLPGGVWSKDAQFGNVADDEDGDENEEEDGDERADGDEREGSEEESMSAEKLVKHALDNNNPLVIDGQARDPVTGTAYKTTRKTNPVSKKAKKRNKPKPLSLKEQQDLELQKRFEKAVGNTTSVGSFEDTGIDAKESSVFEIPATGALNFNGLFSKQHQAHFEDEKLLKKKQLPQRGRGQKSKKTKLNVTVRGFGTNTVLNRKTTDADRRQDDLHYQSWVKPYTKKLLDKSQEQFGEYYRYRKLNQIFLDPPPSEMESKTVAEMNDKNATTLYVNGLPGRLARDLATLKLKANELRARNEKGQLEQQKEGRKGAVVERERSGQEVQQQALSDRELVNRTLSKRLGMVGKVEKNKKKKKSQKSVTSFLPINVLPDESGENLFDPRGLEDKLDLQLDSIGSIMASTNFGIDPERKGQEKENDSMKEGDMIMVDDELSNISSVEFERGEREAIYHSLPSSRADKIPKAGVKVVKEASGSLGASEAGAILGGVDSLGSSQIRRSAAAILDKTI